MEKTLFRFIWRFSAREQIIILFITCCSFPALYYSLVIPKNIVNEAISGTDFPRSYLWIPLDQVPYLLALCFALLAMVVINNALRYILNIYTGITGERMLRRLLYELLERLVRFQPKCFRRLSSAEIIPIITSESEQLGGFIGESIATPVYQGGTLLVYIGFILIQDPVLGAAAIASYPLQAYLIPKLQKRVVRLNRARSKNIRALSRDINEMVTAASEMHARAGSQLHLLTVSERLYQNFRVRYEIYKRRFLIKLLDSFISQLAPFFFYAIGGYMVIQGQISLGSLVAVLAAYTDLAGPWRELLNYYQHMVEMVMRYESVIEHFDHKEMSERDQIMPPLDKNAVLSGELVVESISLEGEAGTDPVNAFSVVAHPGETMVLVGSETTGRSALLRAIGGLEEPLSGKVRLGGDDLHRMSEMARAQAVAFIAKTHHMFAGTLRANLLYGFGIVEPEMVLMTGVGDQRPATRLHEAKITASAHPDLIDFPFLDADRRTDLEHKALQLLDIFGLSDDVYQMGLDLPLGADAPDALRQTILAVRAKIRALIAADDQLSDLIDLWQKDRFNRSASLGENIFFAVPVQVGADFNQVAGDTLALKALAKAGLLQDLVILGADVALSITDLFADVSGDNTLLSAYSFMPIDEFEDYGRIARRAKTAGAAKLRSAQQAKLLALALAISPLRHRIVKISGQLEERIVKARGLLRSFVDASPLLTPIEEDTILPALSLSANLVLGRRRPDRRGSLEKVNQLVRDVAEDQGVRSDITRFGLSFNVGSGGANLSPVQRFRVGLASSLLREPALIICDGLGAGSLKQDKDLLEKIRFCAPNAILVVGTSEPSFGAEMGRTIDL